MPPIRRRTNLGRRTRNATNQFNYQSNRTAKERKDRNERETIRLRQTREARHSTNNGVSLNRAAFCYDMSIDYTAYNCVAIAPMNSVCQYCKSLKYKNEANELCSANGKIRNGAILAAKNTDVNQLNFKIQDDIPGEMRTYKSVDTATNEDDVVNYAAEFLNSFDLSGLPPHNLQLKVGSVVITLRNINQLQLCNGTRLAIKKLLNNVK